MKEQKQEQLQKNVPSKPEPKASSTVTTTKDSDYMKMAFDLLNKQTDLLAKQTGKILEVLSNLTSSNHEEYSQSDVAIPWEDDELSGEVISFDEEEVDNGK